MSRYLVHYGFDNVRVCVGVSDHYGVCPCLVIKDTFTNHANGVFFPFFLTSFNYIFTPSILIITRRLSIGPGCYSLSISIKINSINFSVMTTYNIRQNGENKTKQNKRKQEWQHLFLTIKIWRNIRLSLFKIYNLTSMDKFN